MFRRHCAGLGFLVGLAICRPALAEPDTIDFVIRARPDGATVYQQATTDSNGWKTLGLVNQPILHFERNRFPHGMKLAIGGENNLDKSRGLLGIMPFFGYHRFEFSLDQDFYRLVPEPYRPPGSKIAVRLICYPGVGGNGQADAEPIQLLPEPGFGSTVERWVLWTRQNPSTASATALIACVTLFTLCFVVIPGYLDRRNRSEAEKEWQEKLRDLKTEFDPYLGHVFGGYRLLNQLGAGGMAVVYKGVPEETRNDSEAVAIKIMNPEVVRDVEYRKRFEREIRISKDLDHPNVVRPVTWGENQGVLYFAMEYIEGNILRDLIPDRGFPFPQALELFLDICKGVVYAHTQGIVHRDLKPENIMVTRRGLVKVMDLGLAKRNESENVTKTGDTFGTPAYMSPEQITGGGALTPATDQYALGVLFFELLTGHRPFEVADSLTLVMKHLQEAPPLVRKFKPQLPQEIEVLLDRMLAKDPAKRYPSLADVKATVEKIQQTYVGSPRQV
jgi:hypothetical protein